MQIRRNGNTVRPRRWTKLRGLSPPSKLGVFNNTVDVAKKALAERSYTCKVGDHFEPALPTNWSDFADDYMMMFLAKVMENLPELVPPLAPNQVAECYRGTKRARYLIAVEKLMQCGLSKRDAQVLMFVKFEKGQIDKAPRVINPRSDKYNISLGKFLKKNEHAYFEAIAKVFEQERVVIKGVDGREGAECIKAMWDAFADAIGIGGDASKFDMHVSYTALKYEHLFYLTPLVGSIEDAKALYERILMEDHDVMDYKTQPEELAWLLVQQLRNRGTGYFKDGRIKFVLEGTRASGDLNTSLGNCILMCAMTWSWAQKSGVKMNLANNGDDCMYIMNASDEAKWREGFDDYYRSKGFRMVLEDTVRELEQVEFCQSHPVHVGDHWMMVRNPCAVVTKGSMCLQPLSSEKQLRKWAMAIGVGEGTLQRGVPVLQAFAQAMRRSGVRCSQRDIDRAYSGSNRLMGLQMNAQIDPITDETRSSFYRAFGIDPAAQVALEDHYRGWKLDWHVQCLSAGDFKRAMPSEEHMLSLLVPPV